MTFGTHSIKKRNTCEKKRQDALMPKHQPTPIPEESSEQTVAEGKVRHLVINCATCKLLIWFRKKTQHDVL